MRPVSSLTHRPPDSAIASAASAQVLRPAAGADLGKLGGRGGTVAARETPQTEIGPREKIVGCGGEGRRVECLGPVPVPPLSGDEAPIGQDLRRALVGHRRKRRLRAVVSTGIGRSPRPPAPPPLLACLPLRRRAARARAPRPPPPPAAARRRRRGGGRPAPPPRGRAGGGGRGGAAPAAAPHPPPRPQKGGAAPPPPQAVPQAVAHPGPTPSQACASES